MSTAGTCTACGGDLLTNAGQIFCPVCLLQQGMKNSTFAGYGSRPNWKPPEMEQLAAAFPHLEIQKLLGSGRHRLMFRTRMHKASWGG